MKPTNRLIIALVFLLVAAAIFVVTSKFDLGKVGRGEETSVPTARPSLFSAAPMDEVTRVQVKDNKASGIFVAEKKENAWLILEAPKDSNTGLGVDQERITNALSVIPGLMPSRTLSGIEALANYGLGDDAQYTVIMTIGAKEYTLTIGSRNPGASDYYVQVAGVSDVYLVSTYSLDPVIELLSKPPYIQPTPDPNVTPSATPSATPEVTPSATPSATPEVTPSATPEG